MSKMEIVINEIGEKVDNLADRLLNTEHSLRQEELVTEIEEVFGIRPRFSTVIMGKYPLWKREPVSVRFPSEYVEQSVYPARAMGMLMHSLMRGANASKINYDTNPPSAYKNGAPVGLEELTRQAQYLRTILRVGRELAYPGTSTSFSGDYGPFRDFGGGLKRGIVDVFDNDLIRERALVHFFGCLGNGNPFGCQDIPEKYEEVIDMFSTTDHGVYENMLYGVTSELNGGSDSPCAGLVLINPRLAEKFPMDTTLLAQRYWEVAEEKKKEYVDETGPKYLKEIQKRLKRFYKF